MDSAASARTHTARYKGLAVDDIQAHLQRIFASPAFRASKRCHRFLSYVVEQTLDGKASTLKERTLAVEVFDRSASWDSGDDTIVRVGAREVRKRLAQYYTTAEGIAEKIRIELPSGSYVPEFTSVDYASLTPISAIGLDVPPRAAPSARSPARWPLQFTRTPWLLAVVALPIVLLCLLFLPRWVPSLSDQFWQPFWNSPDPVLVAIANPLVYHPSDRATRLNNQLLGTPLLPEQRALQVPPNELNGADMIPVRDQYVGFGDAAVATEVFALLAKHSKQARLRFGSKLEFDDFRGTPAILIGAFTNRWTAEFTHSMRFHFGYDPNGAPAILDAAHPSHAWRLLDKKADGSSPEDYFLVCRLSHSPTGKAMVITAGITMFGTEAAGHFLANPERLNEALRHIGPYWQNRNLELVFHARVIGNSPSAAELVASYLW